MESRLFKLDQRFYLITLFVIIGALLVPLGLHIYNGSFSRYVADDFCTASILKREGFLQSQVHWYNNWSGRFSFTLIVNLLELIGPGVVPILPALFIFLWVVITAWSLKPFFTQQPKLAFILPSLAFAILIVFSTLDQATNVIQSLYWQTGAITYSLPLLIFTLYFGLITNLNEQSSSTLGAIPPIVLSFVLTFLAGGLSEISAVLQVAGLLLALLIIATFFRTRISRERKTVLTSGLLGAFAALVLVILAPGNEIRRSLFAEPFALIDIARTSLDFGWVFFHKTATRIYMTTYLSVIFPVLFLFTWKKNSKNTPPPRPSANAEILRFLLLTPFIAWMLIVCCMAPSIYGTNSYPPDRALIIPQFVLSVFTVVWGTLLGMFIANSKVYPLLSSLKIRLPIFLFLVGLMLPSPYFSYRRSSILLTPEMRGYASLWDSRDRQIRSVKLEGENNPDVIPLPHLTGLPAIGDDPEDWLNRCVASYYGLNSIVATDQ